VWWLARWDDSAMRPPWVLEPWVAGPPEVVLTGQGLDVLPRDVRGQAVNMEATVQWRRATPGLLLRLLAMEGRLAAVEVHGPGAARVRWRGDTVTIRAPRESPVWFRWRAVEGSPDSALEQTRWRQAGRARRAWWTGRVAGVEEFTADGYREWTLKGFADIRRWLPILAVIPEGRVLAGLRVADPTTATFGPEPYWVERWRLGWSGAPWNTPSLPRTWHQTVRWPLEGPDGHGRVTLDQRAGTRRHRWHIQWRPDVFRIATVRAWARSLPLSDAAWVPDHASKTPEAWYREWVETATAWIRDETTPRPPLHGGARRRWWRRWPAAGPGTAMLYHPRYPDSALVVFHAATGPYRAHLQARWTLHGPRWDLPPGADSRDTLERLAAWETPLVQWWTGLQPAQRDP
jgi:hypothetical protein